LCSYGRVNGEREDMFPRWKIVYRQTGHFTALRFAIMDSAVCTSNALVMNLIAAS